MHAKIPGWRGWKRIDVITAFSQNRVNVLDSVRRGGEPPAVNVRIEPSDDPTATAVGLLGDTWSAVTATGISMVWAIPLPSRSAWGVN